LVSLVAWPVAARSAADFSLEEWRSKVTAEQDVNRLARLYVESSLEADPTFGLQGGIHGKEGR
jgi:hypothetical protein